MTRLRSLLLAAISVGLVVAEAIVYGTGFPGKTLWDWLGLLIVPAALAFAGYVIQRSERDRTDDQLKEQALQTYLDHMSELLLSGKFDHPDIRENAKTVARARTLTVLRGLDGERKGAMLRFLYESGLINGDSPTIDLRTADFSLASLREANLERANLKDTNLAQAQLQGTQLKGANLEGANLEGANLYGADLQTANLDIANLQRANLIIANLRSAHLWSARLWGAKLEGANLRGANLELVILIPDELKLASLDQDTILFDGSHYEPPPPTKPMRPPIVLELHENNHTQAQK